jgi:diguanylate cyclase (GGDEF)-like protein
VRIVGDVIGKQRYGPAAVVACLILAAYSVVRVLPGSETVQETVSVGMLGLVGAAAACAVLQGGGRAASRRERLAWRLIAASIALWAAAELVELLWIPTHAADPTRLRAADNVLALASVVAVTGFIALPGSRSRDATGRTLRLLDTLTVLSTASVVMWMALIEPILDQPGLTGSARVHLLVFVGFDLVTVTRTLLLASRPPAGRRIASTFVAAAVIAFVSGDMHLEGALTAGAYTVGTVGDIGWVAGVLLMAWGAQTWALPPAAPVDPSRWRPVLLPYVLLPVAVVAGVITATRGGSIGIVVASLGAVMIAAILARQLITLSDNMQLVARMSGQEAELRHQAMHDALTGLANRRLFRERLEDAVRLAEDDSAVAVVFVDLDDFKVVNDTLGHAVGDELLRKMANRLQACIRLHDLAARLGGDEFAVLVTDGGEHAAQTIATRLTRAMRQPIVVGTTPVFIQASVGIAIGSPELRPAPGELLEQADMAMYAAKDAGKARLAVFEPQMRERLIGRAAVKDDLHRALGRAQLLLHYQPIVDLASGTITGAEALLRWLHPQQGFIPPLTFIPMAEDTGLINRIGGWVMHTACREAAQWRELYAQPLAVHVNLSGTQLLNPDVVQEVRAVLEETRLPPHLLTIEMTESVLLNDNSVVAAQLAALKGLGVRVAIDDFGTGYSGLSYLDRLPVDVLKVDEAFVDSLDSASSRPPLARAVVGLAEMLDLDVVAEGVETMEQRELLVRMGCRSGQGYFFSRPVAADDLRTLLAAGTLGDRLLPAASIVSPREPADSTDTHIRP